MHYYPQADTTTGDLTVGEDITIAGDAVIGDDADVVGDLTAGTIASDAGVTATTAVAGATVEATTTLKVTRAPGAHAAAPDVAFGDLDTGFYESVDDTLHVATAGVTRGNFTSAGLSIVAQVSSAGSANSAHVVMTGALGATSAVDYADDFDGGQYTVAVFRLNPTAAGVDLNSMVSSQPGVGVWLVNINGTDSVTIKHQGTGTAAYKFTCPGGADFVLLPYESVFCWYDSAYTTWRVMASRQIGAA